MSHAIIKLLPKLVVLSCTLSLLGCSSAINPWYNNKHPQRKQSFIKRHPVRDNMFVENGGLSKKSKNNPFTTDIGANGFYSTNPGIKPINKTTGVYKNPLGGSYSAEVERNNEVIQHRNTETKKKGEESSIMSFFKGGVGKTKSFFSGEDNSPSSQQNAIEQAPTEIKRVPKGNYDTSNQSLPDDDLNITEQGGSSSLGYSYYDFADDLPTPPAAAVTTKPNVSSSEFRKPKVVNNDVTINNVGYKETREVPINKGIDDREVIFYPHPEKTEFDEYCLQQNKPTSSFKGFFKKYAKKASGIFKFNEANAAEIEDNKADSNDEINELSKLNTPIITDQDMEENKKINPDLKDVPPMPQNLKELKKYQEEAKSLEQKTNE
ncbi:hypothetical protein NF27_EY00730 [Candidatus Jidaibacter acanthamoeba]|uniref:Lipoprotein n=1 Tax=Candidatus Jidaibacter acanthamoebae TaxID=86105 RepID=A0A0C1MSH1_9RICK|nr:hypothetical protein [Candidatus Jidaibacter acanthamoeba]KIE04977.1 hypothetical protein NF27_EY00730 [Candidatus Jidaibacter acanthamoeba]